MIRLASCGTLDTIGSVVGILINVLMQFVLRNLEFGVLINCVQCRVLMICFTRNLASCGGGYYRKCGRWMKGFTMC